MPPTVATIRVTDPDTMRALLSELGEQGSETSPGIVGITTDGIRQLDECAMATRELRINDVGHRIVFGDVVTMPEIADRTGYAYASVQSWTRRHETVPPFPRPRWQPSPSSVMWDWWMDVAPWITSTGRLSSRYPLTTGMGLWSDLPIATADVVDANAVADRSGYSNATVTTWLHRDIGFPLPRWFRPRGTKGRNAWDWEADVLPWLISTGRTDRMARERPRRPGPDQR